MNRSLITGITYVVRGFTLLVRPGIRTFVFVPLLVNVSLFGVAIVYGFKKFTVFLQWLEELLPNWLHWLEWILIPLFFLIAILALFLGFSMMANLIAAPFNGFLSDKIERYLTGGTPKGGGDGFMSSIRSSLWNEVKKMSYFLVCALVLLVLSFIPPINFIAPLLWLLFAAWVLVVEYADVPMSNHGLSGKQVRAILRQNPMIALGFGSTAFVMTLIPFINFLVMPTCVVGATIMWVESFASDHKQLKQMSIGGNLP